MIFFYEKIGNESFRKGRDVTTICLIYIVDIQLLTVICFNNVIVTDLKVKNSNRKSVQTCRSEDKIFCLLSHYKQESNFSAGVNQNIIIVFRRSACLGN